MTWTLKLKPLCNGHLEQALNEDQTMGKFPSCESALAWGKDIFGKTNKFEAVEVKGHAYERTNELTD